MKYPGLTPYHYCGNNPLARVDPSGMYFDEDNEVEANAIINEVRNRIEELNSSLEDNSERITELNKSLQDINDMATDISREYRFTHDENQLVETKHMEKNENGHDVIVMNSTSMDSKIHETRHGGQIARGELNLSVGGNYGTEIDAYRAQFGYSGQIGYYQECYANNCAISHGLCLTPSFIKNISEINTTFIDKMVEVNDGEYKYVYNYKQNKNKNK